MNIRKNLETAFNGDKKPRTRNRNRNPRKVDSAQIVINVLYTIIHYLLIRVLKAFLKKLIFFLKTDRDNTFLHCPIRGRIGTKIYDDSGDFTEEYHRINLVKSFLKKGFPKDAFNLNYRIRIGHKGRNFFIPDLVITRSNGSFFLVAEIKKFSTGIQSAIDHQLNPAMKILSSDYGIYYDGTKNSSLFLRNGDLSKNFDFANLPDWIFEEWKRS